MTKDLPRHYKPANGSMAPNEEEMEHLGKQMENLRTNKELKSEYDKQPDPIQYDKNK